MSWYLLGVRWRMLLRGLRLWQLQRHRRRRAPRQRTAVQQYRAMLAEEGISCKRIDRPTLLPGDISYLGSWPPPRPILPSYFTPSRRYRCHDATAREQTDEERAELMKAVRRQNPDI